MFALKRRIFVNLVLNRLMGTLVIPKEVQVKVPWGHIAVKQWGESSKPLVICCHGFLDNAGSFDKLIPLLPKKFTYLAMDFPGHGLSSMADNGMIYTDEFYNESTMRVQRYFGNAVIGYIGHSMGSALGVRYATVYSRDLSFLICMELVVFPRNPMVERIRHVGRRVDKMMRQFAVRDMEPARTKEELLKRMVIGWGGSIDREAAEILLERGAKPVGDKWKLSRDVLCGNNQIFGVSEKLITGFDHGPRDFSFCAIEFLGGIRFNTTELLNENLKVLSKIYKLTEFHAIRGRHHLLLTQPQQVSKIVTEFMDRAAF